MLTREVAPIVRTTKGFRGALFLLSNDDPSAALFITMWETEEDQKSSSTGIFRDAIKKSEVYISAPPEVKSYTIDSGELHL